MRKKFAIIILLIIIIVFVVSILLFMDGKDISTGRCLIANNGSVLWIDEDGIPTELHDKTLFGLPKKLDSGDKIWLIHADAIAESYPGQVITYLCVKISDGDFSDIPKETLKELEEIGWINTKDNTADNNTSDESISNVGGADQPSDITIEETLLISSDEYYALLKETANKAIENTMFSKYSVGVGEYPYYKMVFVVSEKVDDNSFYASAEEIAKNIYDVLSKKEYEKPPFYKYSFNNISIEFYTEANRNNDANCTYQFVINEIDTSKTFKENVSLLTPNS